MVEFCTTCGEPLSTEDELIDKLCNCCLKAQLLIPEDDSYLELDFNLEIETKFDLEEEE